MSDYDSKWLFKIKTKYKKIQHWVSIFEKILLILTISSEVEVFTKFKQIKHDNKRQERQILKLTTLSGSKRVTIMPW